MFKDFKFQFCLATIIVIILAIPYNLQDTGTDEPTANPYCIEGCLRCDPVTLICSICDVALGYIPTINGKGCELGSDENCDLMGKKEFNLFF